MPNLVSYEAWIGAAAAPTTHWPSFDENSASSMCYTSGTTGNPKAALYSHRSTLLHAYAAALPDVMSLSARDSVLPVVPMFHVNAWGIPYSAALDRRQAGVPRPGAGRQVGVRADREPRGVTFAAGVPTVWQMLLGHMQSQRPEVLDPQAHRDRRLGLPAGHDPRLPGASTASRCCTPGA